MLKFTSSSMYLYHNDKKEQYDNVKNDSDNKKFINTHQFGIG